MRTICLVVKSDIDSKNILINSPISNNTNFLCGKQSL